MSRKSSRSSAKVYHLASQSFSPDDHSKQNSHASPKSLRIRLEELITVDPLTDNQRLFFNLYNQGETFIVLHGVAGSGKCQGKDVEVNLMVSDELYEKLITYSS